MDRDTPPATGADLLREYLARTDAPCPSCNYNLRGLTTSVCPECNQDLTLRVNLVEPRLAAWVTGIVGLAAGAGFSGLLVLFGLWMTFVRGSNSGPAGFFIITIAGALVEGSLLQLWVLKGRSIRRLPDAPRFWLAICCWAVTLLNLLAFSILIK